MRLARPQLVALLALTLMWGLNWPIMKFTLRELAPLHFRAVTMTAGAALLFLFYRLRGVPMALPRAAWGRVAGLAVPNILIWHLCSIMGVQALASGRASILGFTMPIWTVLLACTFFGEALTRARLLAVACGMTAVALLVGQEFGQIAGRPQGIVWMQLAASAWALGTIWMRRSTLTVPVEAITTWMMMLCVIPFWLVASLFEPAPDWQLQGLTWAALVWGAVINYGVAQILWFGLARQLPPQAVSFAIMAVPLVGTFSAAFIVGEVPRLTDLAAAALITVAIATALLTRAPSARPAPSTAD